MWEEDPTIIFGAPRSGTTYLNNLINAHPEVYISHEIRLFAWLHESLQVLTQQDRLLVSYRKQFTDYLREVYPRLVRDFYRRRWPQARYWGDKNPHYADPSNAGCLQTIVQLFPKSRFIHIVRDGRDIVSSLIRKQHADGKPWADLLTAHRMWTSHIAIGTKFGRSLGPEQYLEIKYEDLVKDDTGYARRVFEFLRIPLHQNVLAFCEAQQVDRTPFSGPTRDLSKSVLDSEWEKVLTAEQQLSSLELLGPGLVEMGYETADSLTGHVDRLRRLCGSPLSGAAQSF